MITIILISLILFLVSCPIVNNISANHVARDINAIPLPQNTCTVEEFSRAGKLVGNGNGMQFFGAVLVESELSLDDLEQYYSTYRETSWEYIIEAQNTQNIDVIEHGTYSFKTDVSDGDYYIVYSWGGGISPFRDFDLRGY